MIYSAHHDHLGVGAPNASGNAGDRIYNGARDNAAGVGTVLAIGKARSRRCPSGPRRSMMLMFPAAEEQGLLGSEYFAKHPTVPPGKIAADVNYDSPNIWGATRDITFIGLGKSPSLDAVATEVAAYQQRALKGDQFPERGSYYRSDQFNFAKIGVPAFYYERRHGLRRQAAGLGRRAARRVYRAQLSPTERRAHGRMALRRHRAGRAVRLLRGADRRERAHAAGLERPATSLPRRGAPRSRRRARIHEPIRRLTDPPRRPKPTSFSSRAGRRRYIAVYSRQSC